MQNSPRSYKDFDLNLRKFCELCGDLDFPPCPSVTGACTERSECVVKVVAAGFAEVLP